METKSLSNFFSIINDYFEKDEQENKEVLKYFSPEELKHKVDLKIKKDGDNIDKILNFINDYLTYNVKSDSKQFFNQLYGGNNLPAFYGEVLTTLTNTAAHTYEVAPLAMIIEKMLIEKMCKLVGFENGDGIFATGGSNSNMIAMFSARNKLGFDIKNKGIYNLPILKAFVSDQAHYSHETSANTIGIGRDNLIKIKSDKNGKMIPEELEKEILKAKEEGALPFYVAATAATTMLTAIDPLDKISVIAKKHNLWFHVDAALGGSFLLSKKYKYLLKDIRLADSVAWNPHKLMNIPLITSVILTKETGRLKQNLTHLSSDYLFHSNADYNLGEKSLQCGRRIDSIKLFTAWKYYGDNGYEKRIDNLFEIAKYVEKKVKENPKLELQVERQTLSVCFRYIPEKKVDLNKFNIQLRENLMKSGKALVNYGYVGKEATIRFINVNPDVSTNNIDTFFKFFLKEAEILEQK